MLLALGIGLGCMGTINAVLNIMRKWKKKRKEKECKRLGTKVAVERRREWTVRCSGRSSRRRQRYQHCSRDLYRHYSLPLIHTHTHTHTHSHTPTPWFEWKTIHTAPHSRWKWRRWICIRIPRRYNLLNLPPPHRNLSIKNGDQSYFPFQRLLLVLISPWMCISVYMYVCVLFVLWSLWSSIVFVVVFVFLSLFYSMYKDYYRHE
jgi:hypothetical protein